MEKRTYGAEDPARQEFEKLKHDPTAIVIRDTDYPGDAEIRVEAAWGGGGMHNVIFGDGRELSRGTVVVGHLLGFLEPEDDQVAWLERMGRYRDVWLEIGPDGALRIAVLTRLGHLVNSPDYEQMMLDIREHDLYLGEEIMESDSTYLTFFFDIPTKEFYDDPLDFEMVETVIEALTTDKLEQDGTMAARDFNAEWEKIKTEDDATAAERVRPLLEQVMPKLIMGGFDQSRPVHVPMTEDDEMFGGTDGA